MIKTKLQQTYELRDWLEPTHVNGANLSKNPNAINYLYELFKLPKAEYDQLNIHQRICWPTLCSNPNAIFLIVKKIDLESKMSKEDYDNLHHFEKIHWGVLSSNPNAISLLELKIKAHKDLTDKELDKIKDNNKINWSNLSKNYNAIRLLKENIHKIVWNSFLENKKLDRTIVKNYLLKLLSETELKENEKINWETIWTFPKTINILMTLCPEKIDWNQLLSNISTTAIELLTTKAIQEQNLNVDQYTLLTDDKKINWSKLSENSKAIDLLIANPDKIVWKHFSGNTNKKAFELLEQRIKEEEELIPNSTIRQQVINDTLDRINREKLSSNPKAIKLLEKYPKLIYDRFLVINPNAVKLIKKRFNNIKRSSETLYYLSSNPCIFKEL
jgi:hypothetical protein